MNKVPFFDQQVINNYWKIFSTSGTILSIILIFVDIPQNLRLKLGLLALALLLVTYFILWNSANKLTNITLDIGETSVEIKFGDIFLEKGLKVIPFNEYFDTNIDNHIISEESLNGQLITKYYNNTRMLDESIENDSDLQSNLSHLNDSRIKGKKKAYKLGSILVIDDEFILTAMSKFSSNNEAVLTMSEYIQFLMNFWEEISKKYNVRTVVIPIMGSGITRFKQGYEKTTPQDLLEIILWTFEVSKIKIAHPAQLTIVIGKDKKNKINLYKLKKSRKNSLYIN